MIKIKESKYSYFVGIKADKNYKTPLIIMGDEKEAMQIEDETVGMKLYYFLKGISKSDWNIEREVKEKWAIS